MYRRPLPVRIADACRTGSPKWALHAACLITTAQKGVDIYMEIKEFTQKIQRVVAGKLGEDYQVKLQEVQKNNNVILQGLLILTKDRNVTPTIYLNSFWEAYEAGVTLQAIVERILQIYEEDTPKESVDMSFFKNFDAVKDRICYRLISAEQNQELLGRIPHQEYLDLAICFYYAYEGDVLGSGSILIHNTHLEMWNASTEQLLELARSNTPRLFPWETDPMEEVVREMLAQQQEQGAGAMLEEEEQQEFFARMPMQILSNTKRVHGAVCILYPGLLEKLTAGKGQSLYIIPSSIHEVILLPDSGREEVGRLREMISEVNATQVEPEEILSEQLYYYDILSKQVKIV